MMEELKDWKEHPDLEKQLQAHVHCYFTNLSKRHAIIPPEGKHIIFSLGVVERPTPQEAFLKLGYFKLLPVIV